MTTTLDSAIHQSARANALDIYLSALLAPRNSANDLIVLAAFKGEIEAVPLKIREPLVGEIRLQWWRDQITSGDGADARTGNPIADELRATMRRHNLDPADILKMIDAQSLHLYPDQPVSRTSFQGHLADFDGTAFALAAQVLGVSTSREIETACVATATATGRAYGTARLLTRLRAFASHGHWPLPPAPDQRPDQADSLVTDKNLHEQRRASINHAITAAQSQLALATAQVSNLPTAAKPAFLPLALVEPYFKAFKLRRGDPLMMQIDISRLQRRWHLWRASMRQL